MMKTIISIATLCLIFCCTNSKEIRNARLKTVKTNGIYIAYNPYTQMVKDLTSLTPVGEQKSIFIIRFIDQKNGVVIPEYLEKGEGFTPKKVAQLYNWCLDFENKNPEDKQFVHFNLAQASSDSIKIVQQQGGMKTSFAGLNQTDSLVLNYSLGLNDQSKKIEGMKRKLTFKFYPI